MGDDGTMDRRRVLTVAATAFSLAFTPVAGAKTIKPVAQPPLPQPMPEIIIGDCPGMEGEVAGCFFGINEADLNGRSYPTGGVYSLTRDRFTILHELGRAFDATMMDAGERNAFAHLLDRDDEVWSFSYEDEQGRLIEDPRSLAGVFGNAYANCRMGHVVASGHTWEAGYDYYPTARQHRAICAMITRAASDPGTPVAADGWR